MLAVPREGHLPSAKSVFPVNLAFSVRLIISVDNL